MAVLQLRNHIPISGPARREPADGNETALRVSLGFEPAWYSQRCAVDFSEHWHTDPFYRHITLQRMKAELHRAFPMVTYWDPARTDDTWTLSGCYGAYIIPQVFGCRLRYAPDRWPVIIERPKRSLDEWAKLKAADLLEHPFVGELFTQMETIAAAAGKIHGFLSWQSVINNAFNIREQTIFTDMLDQPELTHHFLDLICEVMITLARRVQARQRLSGFAIDQLDISNCVMNMISPRAYRNFILPFDARIAGAFERFGVHTCNWDVTPYLSELSKLPKVGYLDMGIMSDMQKARATFPDARRAVMYSPVRLHDAALAEIRADMHKIYADLAPCDVVMADIQAHTPDERIIALLEICRELEQGH
jgi:uroporphyrinogen-III decarboxylase